MNEEEDWKMRRRWERIGEGREGLVEKRGREGKIRWEDGTEEEEDSCLERLDTAGI